MNNPSDQKNRRVLVIDDNRAIHEDFRKILAPAFTAAALDASAAAVFGPPMEVDLDIKFEVDSAFQGGEGVMLAAQAISDGRPYALAFVDVRMPPGWDGVETTAKLWELDPYLQVVLCTAHSDYSWSEMFEQLGQRDGLLILKKPFDSVEAFQLAHALTEKWRLHQQTRRKMEDLESQVAARTHELQQSNAALRTEVVEHTRAEKALRGKTAFLEAQVNSSLDGIYVADQEGKSSHQNQRFIDLFNLPRPLAGDQADGNPLHHVTALTKNPEHFGEKLIYLNTHPDEISHDETELKDGTFLEYYSSPVVGLEGKYYGRIWTFRDITERKHAEEAFRQRLKLQDQLAHIATTVPGLIYSLRLRPDGSTQMPYASGALRAVFGLQPQDISEDADRLFSLIHPEDLGRVQATMAESARTLNPWHDNFRVCQTRLGEIWVEGNSVPQREPDGSILWHGFAQDITARKRAEEQLLVQASALEAAANGIVITDQNGLILSVNPAYTTLTGYTAAEAIGHNPRILNSGKQDATFFQNLWQTISSGRVWHGELTNRHKDGSFYDEEMTITPLRNAAGAIVRYIAIKQDITARKRHVTALREAKRFLSASLNALTSHIAILDEEGTIIKVNAAWNRFAAENEYWGRQRGVGDNYLQLCEAASGQSSEEAPLVATGIRAVIAGQRDEFHLEYPCPSAREQRWFVVRVTRFAGDGPVRIVVAHENITARKQAEARLIRTEELYRRAIAGAGAVPYALDFKTSAYVFIGAGIEQLIGYTPQEMTGQLWNQIIQESIMTGDTAGLTKDEAARRMAAGEIRKWRCDMRVRTRDGKSRWLSDASVQNLGEAGRPTGSMGILQDVTERKQTEIFTAASSKLAQRLSAIASAREAFDVIQEVARELFGWDAFWLRLYNAKTDSIYAGFTSDGQTLTEEQRAPEQPGELYRRIIVRGAELILRDQPPAVAADQVPFGDASRRSLALMFVPIRSRAQVVGLLSVQSHTPHAYHQQDLNRLQAMADQCGGAFERIWADEALHQSEAQLFQAQKLETVGKLAGGIAHEFNSILTAILGQSELMLGELPAGSPLVKNATEISRAAARAATLTRQLLAYGRKQFLQPETLDLNRVIASMEGMVCQLMGSAVDTQIVPAPDLQTVKADAGQIEQVIVNMAINARDAMPDGGKLTLETANVSFDQESVARYPELKPGDYVMLAITDTGTGMSGEIKARVFEPFFTTKDVGQGTGLGLSTCYGIVKQSGGHITVYSELGRGTTFKIYLPQSGLRTKLPAQSLDPPGLARGTETILLVEDDPALREMAATLLRRLGYTVLTAANGLAALSLKQQRDLGRIDLLFTDVVMPHMSGTELADKMRALSPRTRILFASAYTANAMVHQGVLTQDVALLQKPFTPSALAHKVREVLDQPAAP